MRDAFHQATIAEERIRVVIDDVVARTVEFLGEQRFGECETDGIR